MNPNNSSSSIWRRWAWLPLPLLVGAMAVLWAADVRVVWPLRPLNLLVHYGSAAHVVAFIVIPAARSLLANGQQPVWPGPG